MTYTGMAYRTFAPEALVAPRASVAHVAPARRQAVSGIFTPPPPNLQLTGFKQVRAENEALVPFAASGAAQGGFARTCNLRPRAPVRRLFPFHDFSIGKV